MVLDVVEICACAISLYSLDRNIGVRTDVPTLRLWRLLLFLLFLLLLDAPAVFNVV